MRVEFFAQDLKGETKQTPVLIDQGFSCGGLGF
jgi:hypothetical protein